MKKFWVLLGLFAAVITGMVFLGFALPELSEGAVSLFSEFAQNSGIADENGNLSPLGLFINNSRAALFCMLYGLMPFLFLPGFIIVLNGVIVGLVLAATAVISGAGVLALAVGGILPHGVFEVTALCLAAAFGCTICREIIRCMFGKGSILPMGRLFLHCGAGYIGIVVPLMAAAGVTEAYVTPLVMQLFI